jgi:lipopolysaccharide transport system ATP-binding protein
MNALAIRIEKLGKMYRIGRTQRRYDTLRDRIAGGLTLLLRRLREAKFERHHSETVWALKDVSLEIKRGEVLGIIGRNGAGKSTLLKILSGITEPTEGRIEIHGRIGSLLEVGTGFHPELTGRDNIYLNGAILGMKRNEIRNKFDEIVAFAEVEKFIGTPIKHYSSGMYLRLAFAVAAHLEPEILLVDEVLAVGDYAFQKKCLNKMDNVARSGRTVLFVSHNMPAVNVLCKRAILLEGGRIISDGLASEVIQTYLNPDGPKTGYKTWNRSERPGNRAFQLISVSLKNAIGACVDEINISEDVAVEIEYDVLEKGARTQFSVVLSDANGYCVFSSLSNTRSNVLHGRPLRPGHYLSTCTLYGHLLNNGRYTISVIGYSEYWVDSFRADHVITIEAIDDGVLKGDYAGRYGGVVRPKLNWTTVPLEPFASNDS